MRLNRAKAQAKASVLECQKRCWRTIREASRSTRRRQARSTTEHVVASSCRVLKPRVGCGLELDIFQWALVPRGSLDFSLA